jgi:hypothetical protein
MSLTSTATKPRALGLLHAAATGAAVVVFLFVLLWATSASGTMPHLRALFGPMGAGSPFALLVAALYALALGALIGLLVAIFHNAFRFLAPARH